MTDLENFSGHALEHDGIWNELESCKRGSMYESQACYTDGSRKYYTPPVYQVYDEKGSRKLATLNYNEAYRSYKKMVDKREW